MKSLKFIRDRKGMRNPLALVAIYLINSLLFAVLGLSILVFFDYSLLLFAQPEFYLQLRELVFSDLFRAYFVLAALFYIAEAAPPVYHYLRTGEYEAKSLVAVLASAIASFFGTVLLAWLAALVSVIAFMVIYFPMGIVAWPLLVLLGVCSIPIFVIGGSVYFVFFRGK